MSSSGGDPVVNQLNILLFLEDFRRGEVEESVRGQVDKVIEYFNRGHNVDGLILFMQICVPKNRIDDCLSIFVLVEEHEIVAALEWSKNIFLRDVVERDRWSFYIQIMAKLLENPPSHKTLFYILTKIGDWVTFDQQDQSSAAALFFNATLCLHLFKCLDNLSANNIPTSRFSDSLRSIILDDEVPKNVRQIYLTALCYLVKNGNFEFDPEEEASISPQPSLIDSTHLTNSTCSDETITTVVCATLHKEPEGTHDVSDLKLEAFFEDENSSKNVFPEVQVVGKLVVLSSGQEFGLISGSSFKIGRSSRLCQLVIRQLTVSRFHAEVFTSPQNVYVQFTSAKIIKLNRHLKRVTEQGKVKVCDGDILTIGDEDLKFEWKKLEERPDYLRRKEACLPKELEDSSSAQTSESENAISGDDLFFLTDSSESADGSSPVEMTDQLANPNEFIKPVPNRANNSKDGNATPWPDLVLPKSIHDFDHQLRMDPHWLKRNQMRLAIKEPKPSPVPRNPFVSGTKFREQYFVICDRQKSKLPSGPRVRDLYREEEPFLQTADRVPEDSEPPTVSPGMNAENVGIDDDQDEFNFNFIASTNVKDDFEF